MGEGTNDFKDCGDWGNYVGEGANSSRWLEFAIKSTHSNPTSSDYNCLRCYINGSWKETDAFLGIRWFCFQDNGEESILGVRNLQ